MPPSPIHTFSTAKEWRTWLTKNHSQKEGIWLRFFKKDSGMQGIAYAEALDEALCYGWIDGQVKKYDGKSWVQKFTPRRPRSMWSKRNREHVARLITAKKMRAPGLREVEAAKKDGRWDGAYDSPKDMQVPADFLSVVNKDAQLRAFYATLNRANTYAIAFRLNTAKKPETRARRFAALVALLKQGKKLH
jgi:uncharacterized protein YdeI (YjbR/CyaY-like superfamily)